jgi:class 3 adenylate cyclase/predicted metal-dependent HD superfamily phosphohydrolase/ActR/RegA family two-component response regulator
MERFINLLIIDEDDKSQKGLKGILGGGGNNILSVHTFNDAIPILSKKEIGILLINIDCPSFPGFDVFRQIKEISIIKSIYIIVISKDIYSGSRMIKGLHEGAIDFITKPFNPNLIVSKIEVYKALFYKDQRIGQLLSNIFPQNVLDDLNTNGKFSPKRVENGVVLFTDFVNFSQKASKVKPMQLLRKLEHYFTHFDEIIGRYNLEKIKTIGDSYMVLGGVTENNKEPAIRACLAALEIRDFMINEKIVAKAMKQDYWEIRIGIHQGPLVAGIIGTKKFSFDVWGDTVNIASRAEHSAQPNTISITSTIADQIKEYFEINSRGNIDIKKRGGQIEMFFMEHLKIEHSFYKEGKLASPEILAMCELSQIDFNHMRKNILNILKASLPDEVAYHDLSHTLNVEKAVARYAKLEGLTEDEMIIIQTAALYHDAGFILTNKDNEEFAANLASIHLPKFGYKEAHIEEIISIIHSTHHNKPKKTLLQKIMCDADHDYFGRADYYSVANRLRTEMANYGTEMSDKEWLEYQLKYLEGKHRFFTETAKNIRLHGKVLRIQELKNELNRLSTTK